MTSTKVGFIGSGMMAEALGGGLAAAGIVPWKNIYCTDPWQPRLDLFTSFGATACKDNCELVKNSDVIFIAVKPYTATAVLKEVTKELTKDKNRDFHLRRSNLGHIRRRDTRGRRPSGESDAKYAVLSRRVRGGDGERKFVRDEQSDLALKLMQSVGVCVVVQEKLLDAVTGVSGSWDQRISTKSSKR